MPAYLIIVGVTVVPEPQAQELLVYALWLLMPCMPALIGTGQPVPAHHTKSHIQGLDVL